MIRTTLARCIFFGFVFWMVEGDPLPGVLDTDTIKNVFTNSCIEDLGCFYTGPPFYDSTNRPLSMDPDDKPNVKFYLFTPENPSKPYNLSANETSVQKSPFNAEKETKIFIHGFMVQQDWNAVRYKIKDALLEEGGYNVIVVDWSDNNKPPYEKAVANTRVVGAMIARLIKVLMKIKGITAQTVHIIGHSLGAHTAGYAGKRTPHIGRITGLDPAGPYYHDTDPTVRLDSSDADFVDVIHTDAAEYKMLALGINETVGHIDFYPNSGRAQPGCAPTKDSSLTDVVNMTALWLTHSCDHSRSKDLYLESIKSSDCKFMAVRCDSYDDFKDGKCPPDDSNTAEMGFHAKPDESRASPGKYYLRTEDKSPYCIENGDEV